MKTGRSGSRGILLAKTGSWIITGGFGFKNEKLNCTEILEIKKPGENLKKLEWTLGPMLPEAVYLHCIVELDDDNLFLIGGKINPNSTKSKSH